MKARTRAVAILIALMLTSFLFVLGISLLYLIDHDSYSSLGLEREQKVQLLAQTGLNYARYIEQTQGTTGMAPLIFANPASPWVYNVDSAGLEQFELWTDSSDNQNYPVHSVGLLKDGANNVLARREWAAASAKSGIMDFSKMNLVIWDVDLP